jgi:hypothetical protein
MKIRTGFVSNSSGSSFILVHIPDDFDFDVQKEALMDKFRERHQAQLIRNPKAKMYVPEGFDLVTESDIRELRRRGHVYEGDENEKFWGLYEFLSPFALLNVEVQEEGGWIKVANKAFFDKAIEIENKIKEDNIKYSEAVKDKKQRKALLRDKMKGVDPYSEEDWDEIDESKKIKKIKL